MKLRPIIFSAPVRKALCALSLVAVTSIPSARATVVFDPTNFYANIQQYYQFIEQLRATYDQLETMYHQLEYAERQYQAMSHPNYWKQFITRRPDWLPRNWEHTQSMLEKGYNPGDAEEVDGHDASYKKGFNQHMRDFPRVDPTLISKDTNSVRVKQYDLENKATAEAAGTSRQIHESLVGVEGDETQPGYRKAIDQYAEAVKALEGATDMKDTLDLQASMQIMQMQMQADMMVLMQHQLQLQQAQSSRNLASTAQSAKFFGTSPVEHAKKK